MVEKCEGVETARVMMDLKCSSHPQRYSPAGKPKVSNENRKKSLKNELQRDQCLTRSSFKTEVACPTHVYSRDCFWVLVVWRGWGMGFIIVGG